MADTSYATKDALEKRLAVGPGSTPNDDWLQQLLNAAAVTIDEITRGYKAGYEAFSAIGSDETRYFDDDETKGWVDIDDAISITTVKRSGITIDPQFYKLAPYNPGKGPYTQIIWARWLVSPSANNFYSAQFPNKGAGQVAVTGKFGYCNTADLPSCVTEACLKQAQLWFESGQLVPAQLGAITANPSRAVREDIRAILAPVMRGVRLG